jgi:hypothetical protein
VPNSTGTAATSKATLMQSREIRALLEQLSDVHQTASSILSRADHVARNDRRARLTQVASNIDMWAPVDPSTFEPTIEEELSQYDCFRDEVIDLENFVTELLDKVKVVIDLSTVYPPQSTYRIIRRRTRSLLLLERTINR